MEKSASFFSAAKTSKKGFTEAVGTAVAVFLANKAKEKAGVQIDDFTFNLIAVPAICAGIRMANNFIKHKVGLNILGFFGGKNG